MDEAHTREFLRVDLQRKRERTNSISDWLAGARLVVRGAARIHA